MSKIPCDLIEHYELRIVEPGCSPGSGRWGVLVSLPRDISEVFPYLNTVFINTTYDHANKILIIRDKNQAYAFRPQEIRVARTDDPSQAAQITKEIVEKVNSTWKQRDEITPLYTEKKHVGVIDVYKLLPKTNCRKCGHLTCLAYAADLRQGTIELEDCPSLSTPEYAERRQKLSDLFVPE